MSARTQRTDGASPDQLFFSFVPKATRQELAERWRHRIERSDASAVRRAETARKQISLKVIDGRTLPIDWTRYRHLLDLPLSGYCESDLDVQPATDSDERSTPAIVGPDENVEPKCEWTDHDIEVVHAETLVYSLNLLKSKGNAEEKFEILHWIWAPPIYAWKSQNIAGVRSYRPIYSRNLPFSFELCCMFGGWDPERLRDGLEDILRPVLKKLGIDTNFQQGMLNGPIHAHAREVFAGQ
jgi:hypothetical protein